MNPSGINPVEFNVVVRQDEATEKTSGGLYLPDEQVERDKFSETQGVLVAVSPLAFTYDDWPEGTKPPKPDDRIVFARHAGVFVKGNDGEEYRIVKDKDVMAIIEAKDD